MSTRILSTRILQEYYKNVSRILSTRMLVDKLNFNGYFQMSVVLEDFENFENFENFEDFEVLENEELFHIGEIRELKQFLVSNKNEYYNFICSNVNLDFFSSIFEEFSPKLPEYYLKMTRFKELKGAYFKDNLNCLCHKCGIYQHRSLVNEWFLCQRTEPRYSYFYECIDCHLWELN